MTNTFDDNEQRRTQAAIDHIRSLRDPKRLAHANKIASLNNEYISFSRDGDIHGALQGLVDSTTAPPSGKPDKRRIVAICGRSGSGKSTAIAKHISRILEMQPYVDADGVMIRPVLPMAAPSPCNPKAIAVEGIEALGHRAAKDVGRAGAWREFRRLLCVHKVMFVVIDEAQHLIETASVTEATIIGDALKELTQMAFPVRLILAGVAPLGSFLARKQLHNRKTVVNFTPLTAGANGETVREIVRKVVVDHAKLELGFDLTDDFVKRLLHACDGDTGTVIQLVRSAVEGAIYEDAATVSFERFVDAYAGFSGCVAKQNVFTAADWEELDPKTAHYRDDDRAWEEEKLRSKGKNATKRGVRPQ
ncbi:TniB family NTP-binding protein [Rhizobium leguminosarum]|uniref:TniB family NTP-binding protein n=1 Tax=Rhizobium leguminosarum TaxID=384 RepID=UPI0013EE5847|nr:AAA family ATPase [Rhizobium leguminosarum]